MTPACIFCGDRHTQGGPCRDGTYFCVICLEGVDELAEQYKYMQVCVPCWEADDDG